MIGVSEWVSMHLLNLESWKVETLVFFCEMSNGPFEISLDSRRPMNSQQQLSDTVKKGVKLWLCLRSAMCNVSHHAHESSQLIIPVNLCCLCCSAHKQSISIFIFTFRIGYIFCFLLFSFVLFWSFKKTVSEMLLFRWIGAHSTDGQAATKFRTFL